jgi:hypothetical protein
MVTQESQKAAVIEYAGWRGGPGCFCNLGLQEASQIPIPLEPLAGQALEVFTAH